ncbi:GNAT family N-acetyltransferase [Streptomyces sp. SID10853]|uniref:GNAT family N-acetyltransferase n=1 Tax=Streptomyces sp. SID10853 TaxID=2706028 RepID=UPI0013C028AD|nr:GNAT family N-acetyltransferase [Streptomyces sp. SID10853]NDZ77257.1 GNAT family N-acetyltransferase [Streptomyces sp. SID10853]
MAAAELDRHGGVSPSTGDLVTARLVLHPLTVDEAERLVAGRAAEGDRWAAAYPTAGDISAARRFLAACAAGGAPHPGAYEIRRRGDAYAIGGVDFHGPPDEEGSLTIGYGLVPAAQGKGYASEAVRAVLNSARARGFTRVKGDADHENAASHRVMTAVGMTLTGQDERVKYYEVAWDGIAARQTADPPPPPCR